MTRHGEHQLTLDVSRHNYGGTIGYVTAINGPPFYETQHGVQIIEDSWENKTVNTRSANIITDKT